MLETTQNDILYGRLKLLQPLNGPRVNLDTILLSAWVKIRSGHGRVLEAGCASGAISLLLVMKYNNIHVTGIDIQSELVELANINAENNNLLDKVKFINGDLRDKNILPSQYFDVLVINPPYESLTAGRKSPEHSRTTARLELTCTPHDVAEFAYRVLKSRGRLFTIFKSERLDVFLSAMKNKGIIPKRLRPVYPKMNYNSDVFLSEFIKDGGEGMNLLPPLFVRDENNNYTQEILKAYEPDGFI